MPSRLVDIYLHIYMGQDQDKSPTQDIGSLGQYFSQATSQYLLQTIAPVLGFLVIYTALTIGGFYFECLRCSINQVIINTSYCFVISLFNLQEAISKQCGASVNMKLIALYAMMPTIIFTVVFTIPLWSGLSKLWERTVYAASLPANVFGGLITVFVSMLIYVVTINASALYLIYRVCESDNRKTFWTFFM